MFAAAHRSASDPSQQYSDFIEPSDNIHSNIDVWTLAAELNYELLSTENELFNYSSTTSCDRGIDTACNEVAPILENFESLLDQSSDDFDLTHFVANGGDAGDMNNLLNDSGNSLTSEVSSAISDTESECVDIETVELTDSNQNMLIGSGFSISEDVLNIDHKKVEMPFTDNLTVNNLFSPMNGKSAYTSKRASIDLRALELQENFNMPIKQINSFADTGYVRKRKAKNSALVEHVTKISLKVDEAQPEGKQQTYKKIMHFKVPQIKNHSSESEKQIEKVMVQEFSSRGEEDLITYDSIFPFYTLNPNTVESRLGSRYHVPRSNCKLSSKTCREKSHLANKFSEQLKEGDNCIETTDLCNTISPKLRNNKTQLRNIYGNKELSSLLRKGTSVASTCRYLPKLDFNIKELTGCDHIKTSRNESAMKRGTICDLPIKPAKVTTSVSVSATRVHSTSHCLQSVDETVIRHASTPVKKVNFTGNQLNGIVNSIKLQSRRQKSIQKIDSIVQNNIRPVTQLPRFEDIIRSPAQAKESRKPCQASDYEIITTVSIGCNTCDSVSLKNSKIFETSQSLLMPLEERVKKSKNFINLPASSLLKSIQTEVLKQEIVTHQSEKNSSCTTNKFCYFRLDPENHGENRTVKHICKSRKSPDTSDAIVQTDYVREFTKPSLGPYDTENKYRVFEIPDKWECKSKPLYSEYMTKNSGFMSKTIYLEENSKERLKDKLAEPVLLNNVRDPATDHNPRDYCDTRRVSPYYSRTRNHMDNRRKKNVGKDAFAPRDRYRNQWNHNDPAVQRRIIFVGKLELTANRAVLERKFEMYGNITQVSVHSKPDGLKYGFVTFSRPECAIEALSKGPSDPNINMYDLNFGGRRRFCKTQYCDLDSEHTNL